MYADAGKRVHMYGCKQICSMFCLHLIKADMLKVLLTSGFSRLAQGTDCIWLIRACSKR